MALCFFLQALPITLLFWAHEAWQFYLFAVLFGIGFGGEMSAFPIINRQYYGNAPTGTVYGWQMLGAGVGMASGAFLGGVLRDLTGDYTLSLACSFVLSLTGATAILILPSTSPPSDTEVGRGLPSDVRAPVPARSGRLMKVDTEMLRCAQPHVHHCDLAAVVSGMSDAAIEGDVPSQWLIPAQLVSL